MKTKLRFLLLLLIVLSGCVKEDDISDAPLTPGYTTISGQVITSGNKPLKGVSLQMKYIESQYLASFRSWLKKEAETDGKGTYSMSFNIKDNEVESYEGGFSSYFQLFFDFSKLDPDKYFLSYYCVDGNYSFDFRPSLKQDTSYRISCYIPAKDYITVKLNNFNPVLEGDCFEVETFFPWGIESGNVDKSNQLLNTEYGISSSGYGNFVAISENQTFRVPVARNDTNIVRIIKMKNGVATPEDHKLFIPENNNIELSYEY